MNITEIKIEVETTAESGAKIEIKIETTAGSGAKIEIRINVETTAGSDRCGAEIQIDVEAPCRKELTVKSGTGAHEGTNATRRKLDVRRKIEPSERVI
jgi:ribosomal protein S6E (S10)